MVHTATAAAPAPPLGARQVAEQLDRVADMIAAGNPRAARRALEALVAAADDPTAALLRSCLQALERSRPVALAALRRLWQDADAEHRQVVEACVPRGPATAARPAARPAVVAARGPREHTTRHDVPRGTRDAAAANAARSATRYFAEDAAPGGVDALTDAEPDARDQYPDWVDDEALALVPASGTLCVSCWIERPTAEQRRRDDDGLCAECRDAGVTGIPASAEPRDRAGRMQARVVHIAEQATGRAQALSLLRGEYHRARGADKVVIVAWVDAHLPD